MGCCSSQQYMIALFDYEAIKGNQTSISKGDCLILQSVVNPDWTKVYNTRTKQEGVVPSSYIEEDGALEAQDWYFKGTSRREAENVLMNPKFYQGMFLVRPSDREKGGFSLSVRVSDGRNDHVKHFKIEIEDKMYYISKAKKFRDLQSFVQFYKTSKFFT
jgi:hemopoietic cell kinase